jgi:hypothetical protein
MYLPITVVDNFFETPTLIRDFALSCEFPGSRGYHPGIRTNQIHEINPNLFHYINKKLFYLFFDEKHDSVEWRVESQFQLTSAKYEEGWAHTDSSELNWDIAGVVYLTPNAPVEAGTTIYRKISEPNPAGYVLRNQFYTGQEIDMDAYRKARDEHNSHFEKTLEIGNVFNRLVMYNVNDFHKESKFFGTNKEDSRLTLIFFAALTLRNGSRFPIVRSRLGSHF